MPFSIPILILQITTILAACHLAGMVFHKLHQPRVVGEMFAGILLGPSLLGRIAPHLSAYLFPPASLSILNALSQVGVILFMFLVGLGINPKELKNQGHTAILTSHVSITTPFVLGAFLAIYLYPRLSDDSVSFTSFVLFIGASMSITAFPVLARILSERNLLESRLGTVAIACAAVDDVTGWCILACIVTLIRTAHSQTPFWINIVGLIAFTFFMVHGLRRLVRRMGKIYAERGELSENLQALIFILLLGSALCTERLGIHLLFGSFLMGAIMPREPEFVRHLLNRFEAVTVTLLLPLFFAHTGLRTNIGLLKGSEMLVDCAVIVLVATGGKLGGSMLAAWLTGMPAREAAGLGTLMNTRGLMELVVLNIGLDIKVVSPILFSMMVLMALVTTFMTAPVLALVCPNETAFRERNCVNASTSLNRLKLKPTGD